MYLSAARITQKTSHGNCGCAWCVTTCHFNSTAADKKLTLCTSHAEGHEVTGGHVTFIFKDSWKMLWGKKQWNYKQICHKRYIFTDPVTHYLFSPPYLQLLEPFFNQKRCSSSRHWDRKRDLHQSRSKVKLASVVHHTSVKPWGIFIVFDVKNTRYRNSYYCIIVEKHYSLLIFTNWFYPNQ